MGKGRPNHLYRLLTHKSVREPALLLTYNRDFLVPKSHVRGFKFRCSQNALFFPTFLGNIGQTAMHPFQSVPQEFVSSHITRGLAIIRRRQWHPTPVLWPGKSHGRRSLVGCSPWGREESDTTEQLHFHFSLSTFMHWRRKWQPTPVFLPGESQGWQSLVGSHLWGRTESDTAEAI